MFELRGVSKRFGTTTALADVDLVFPAGRTVALLGPSGCGKSTLLRLLVGLVLPDGGEVRFDGRLLTGERMLEERRRMGYVLQEGGLFPHLTAERNVTLLGRYLGRSEEELDRRLHELAELTHFPVEALDRYPAQLSGGQRQRLALMRALALDPAVLLLDEPLGALDPMIRSDLQGDLREIFRELEKTVVLVTHDLAEAGFLGDEIVLLRDGRTVQRGTLRELVERPAEPFVSRFVRAQRGTVPGPGTGAGEGRA